MSATLTIGIPARIPLSHNSEVMIIFTIPIGVDDETKIALRKLPVAIHKETASERRYAVAGDGHILEDALTDCSTVHVKTSHCHLQIA